MKEQHRRSAGARTGKGRSDFSLLMVQGVICGVVLLLVLLLRLMGGKAWSQLRTLFRQWITDDGWVQTITERLAEENVSASDRSVRLTSAAVSPLSAEPVASVVEALPQGKAPMDNGKVTSPFGVREDPLRGGTGFHSGIDVAAEEGTPLYATHDGLITASRWEASYGYYITVRCAGGFEITYAHCSRLLHDVGETVSAGETIALVGSTGDSTGPHVHVMVSKDGVYSDPSALIPEAWYA